MSSLTPYIAIAIAILLAMALGRYFNKNKNAGDSTITYSSSFHDAIYYLFQFLLIGGIFALEYSEVVNVGSMRAHNLNIENPYYFLGILAILNFTFVSVFFRVFIYAIEDGKISKYEVINLIFMAILITGCQAGFLYSGYNVHIAYYENAIYVKSLSLKSLTNAVEAKKMYNELLNLQLDSWKGLTRFHELIMHIVLTFSLVASSTIFYITHSLSVKNKEAKKDAKEKEDEKEIEEKDKDLSKGGGNDHFLKPLSSPPDPFRDE